METEKPQNFIAEYRFTPRHDINAPEENFWSIEMASGEKGGLKGKIFLRAADETEAAAVYYGWSTAPDIPEVKSLKIKEPVIEGGRMVMNFTVESTTVIESGNTVRYDVKPVDALMRLYKVGFLQSPPGTGKIQKVMPQEKEEVAPSPPSSGAQPELFETRAQQQSQQVQYFNIGQGSQIESVLFTDSQNPNTPPEATIKFWSKYEYKPEEHQETDRLADEAKAMLRALLHEQQAKGPAWTFNSAAWKGVSEIKNNGTPEKKYHYTIKAFGQRQDDHFPSLRSLLNFLDGVKVKNEKGADVPLTSADDDWKQFTPVSQVHLS